MAKRTEETLNTLAALEDVPRHFEVLHYGQVSGNHTNLWPYYLVPNLVKKYDVDLVLFLLTPNLDMFPFYQYPYTPEGIPAAAPDAEFFLKPVEKRIQPGLPRELFDLCMAKKLVTVTNNQVQFAYSDLLTQDPKSCQNWRNYSPGPRNC